MIRRTLGLALLAVLLLAPQIAQITGNSFFTSLATRGAIMALAAISLQFLMGFAGLASFGHAAFLGLGAYTLLILGDFGLDDLLISLPAAIAVAVLFALGSGWIALRTRGVAFIMVTLALAQIVFFIAGSLSIYGGDDGANLARRPPVFGEALLRDRFLFHYVAVVILLAMLALYHALSRSRFGRVLRAAKENEARVTALGYDVRRVRLIAYAFAGAGGAIAGWLLSVQVVFVSPAAMDWRMSAELMIIVILGGVASPLGAVIGAVGWVFAEEFLGSATEYWRMILGASLLLIALFAMQDPDQATRPKPAAKAAGGRA